MKGKKVVRVGTKVKVEITGSKMNSSEQISFTLTDDERFQHSPGNVHVDSPLGRCIIGQPVGFQGEYAVLESNLKVVILKIE